MHACTHVEVGLDRTGRTIVHRSHCEVPLLVLACPGDDGLTLLLVNGAAGPLGGDVLSLTVVIGDHCVVRVRSVAASIVQPGPCGTPSRFTTRVRVGHQAQLDWELEPTVSVASSQHSASTVIEAAETATVRFVDSVSLGRSSEPSGVLALRQRLIVGGTAVLDHETVFGPGVASGPGAHGAGRTATSVVIVADDAPSWPSAQIADGGMRGVFPLAPRCALVTSI